MKLIKATLASSGSVLQRFCFRKKQITCGFRSFSLSPSAISSYSSPISESYYNEEQKSIQATVKKLIDTDINPFVDEWEAKEECPSHELLKKFGSAGLLGIRFPVANGGLGLDYKYQAAYLEEMGTIRAGGVIATITGPTEICLPALSRFGSNELKKEFLDPTISGDAVVCLGVTEASAGSDIKHIKTTALPVRNSDDLVINGSKMFITNGMKAEWMCLFANTSTGAPHKNKSLICVPMNSKGITKTKINKLGWHTSDTAQIFLEDVRVPAKNIIGEGGLGFLYQMLQFQEERLGIALGLLKQMDLALADTIDYTRQRQAFGKSVLDNQYVHFRLAELAAENEALRALVYQAVDMMVNGENVVRLASMAKLKVGRLVREVADSCLQFHGGMGYVRESFISRLYRDGRLLSIGGGADEIMLEIICKLMGTSPKHPQEK